MSALKQTAILLSLVLLLCNCKKNDLPASGSNNNKDTMFFSVSGFKDTAMLQTDTISFPIDINHISGGSKAVSITLSGLPLGLTLSIIPQIDTPDYESIITLIAHNAVTGSYPVKLTATSNEMSRSYTMMLDVDTILPNPALVLVGNYIETGNCSTTGTKNNNVEITINGTGYNEILISDFWTTAGTVDAIASFDPELNSVTIPSQQIGPLIVSGTGTYNGNTIDLHYSITDGNIVNDTCTTVLSKQ